MSYYRRGYQWEQVKWVPAPTQGWNADAPWHELPAGQASVLDNFLVKPGKITLRGALTVPSDLSAFTPLNARGVAVGNYVSPGVTAVAAAGSGANNAAVGTVAWTNPNNVALNDPSHPAYATAIAPTGLTVSEYLVAKTFGFAIPVGATILGIAASVRRASFVGTVTDNSVKLVKAGAVVGNDEANTSPWPMASFVNGMYGGPADLWGVGWTPADINNAGFGIAIAANMPVVAAGPTSCDTPEIDYVAITVYYTVASGLNVATSQWFLVGRKTVGTVPTVDHWDVPTLRPTVSGALGVGTGTGVWAVPGSATGLASLNPTPGPRWTNFDGKLYGISYDDLGTGGTAHDVNSNYITWKTKLLTLPLVQSAGTVPTILANAPNGAYDVKGYLSRIWLLGGIDTPGAGTTHSCTTLFFTNPIVSGGGSSTSDWQDSISGLTNQIVMDRDTSDPGVALAIVRNGLIILRRTSTWLLRGTTSTTFVLAPVNRQVGCIDARSVVETASGVYFLSREGLMFTDGVNVKNVSGLVLLTLQQALATQQQSVQSLNGGYATCAMNADGKLMISIGGWQQAAGAPTGHIQPIWSALFDPATNTWTRITSQLWSSDVVQAMGTTNLYPGLLLQAHAPDTVFTLGDKYITALAGLLQDAPSALYDQLPSGGTPFVSIPAAWKTHSLGIIGTTTLTRKFGQAKRYFVDYLFTAAGLTPTTGWAISPVDAADVSLATPLTVAASTDVRNNASSISTPQGATLATPGQLVQRVNQDFANELHNDLGFDVTWSDAARSAAPSAAIAELYGIGVEYQPTSDQR